MNVLLGEINPIVGQSFQIFDLSSPVIGQFNLINLPSLSNGLTWNTNILYQEGIIQVESIPAPGAIVLVGIGASIVGWLRKRKTI